MKWACLDLREWTMQGKKGELVLYLFSNEFWR